MPATGPASRVLLALTLAVFLLPLAARLPLLDPDEGLHAAIAREMAERGDWVTPRLLGEPFLDKPILFFWAQAAAIRLLGASEPAVRLPGVLLGLLGALATGWLARRVYDAWRGHLAMACYATMLLPLALAQAPVHDVALVPCIALALSCFWRAAHVGPWSSQWRWCGAAGVALGVSVLAKGLAGVAITGVGFGLWLLAVRRVRLSLVAGGVLSLMVAAAIAAPWYLEMDRANPGYFHYYFIERHLLGFSTTTQIHGDRAWWYYLPIVLAGSLPWGLYLASARAKRDTDREGDWLAWCWLVGGTVFLSVSGSKMVTYVWPVFPAVAMLASGAWAAESPPRWARAAHTLVGVLLVPAAALVAVMRFDVQPGIAAWIAIVVLAVGWLVAGPHRAFSASHDAARAAGLTAASFLVAMMVVMPPVASTLSARDLARYLNGRGALPTRVWVLDERIGSLLFYLDASHRAGLQPGRIENVGMDRLLSMRQPPQDTVVAVPHAALGRLSERLDLTQAPRVRVGHYEVFPAEALHAAIARTLGTRH